MVKYMAKYKNYIFVALVLFLAVEILIIFPQKLEQLNELEHQNTQAGLQTSDDGADQKMQGAHLVISREGRRDWELFSESAQGSQGKGAWSLAKVKVLFYNNDIVDFTVIGDEGVIQEQGSRDLSIRGNVTTTSSNGYVFKTETVNYSSKDRQIVSPSQVEVIGPDQGTEKGLRVTGQNMLVLVDQSKMVIRKNVFANKGDQEGKSIEVLADQVELSSKNNEAVFSGNVKMRYGQFEIEGPEAAFKYSGQKSLLSEIEIKGGVKVTDEDKLATAQSLKLDVLLNQMTFQGQPKVIQNEDEISGEEIIFLDGGKKVKVEKVNAKVKKAP